MTEFGQIAAFLRLTDEYRSITGKHYKYPQINKRRATKNITTDQAERLNAISIEINSVYESVIM